MRCVPMTAQWKAMKLTFPSYLWQGDRYPHPHIIPQLVNSLNKRHVLHCQLLTHMQSLCTYTPNNDVNAYPDIYTVHK